MRHGLERWLRASCWRIVISEVSNISVLLITECLLGIALAKSSKMKAKELKSQIQEKIQEALGKCTVTSQCSVMADDVR